ncbi:MAG: D-alanyl-D-alanine carboxypeptidase family protein [Peptococcaceae bacterium]|nr:D-alanyl-D-alanine carboxypeptidase [Peptococcaceae bacterium]MDH7524095.1 D-alanyl-D-alanine carboxypeptidase family protein [Peptococcaceae bacterium]
MRRKAFLVIIVLAGILYYSDSTGAVPVIQARSAVLMEKDSGKVLYKKNDEQRRPPASTTKILTAILAIECGKLDEVIEISENAAVTGEATIHLKRGDRLTLYNLLHGALLRSGNDACVAIAEAVAPSEEEFVGLMNLKALTLGACSTTFQNPNGLPGKDHLTTAYDLALIARYAMNNQTFAGIVKKKEYLLRWEGSTRTLHLKNTNRLLWSYPYATGVKTGTTDKAGQCLVASASRMGREVIAVLLHSPSRFLEAQRLLEYGLNEKGVSYE